MDKLGIRLNEDYKQFKKGFNIELKGKLIIISGVNGSGKSQLIDILSKKQLVLMQKVTNKNDIQSMKINSEVFINDKNIDSEFISRRSFKENINIENIKFPDPKNIIWHKEQAWMYFSNYNLWRDEKNEYSKTKKIISERLKEHSYRETPKIDFNKLNNTDTGISKEEFFKVLPDDFIWEKDDLFSNKIDELFYEFAAKRNNFEAKLGRSTGGFNNEEYIKNAPWTILNELFEILNFKYRFKKDYDFETPNFKEVPMIYPVLQDGNCDLSSPRELSDLSDGEKTIISLTFALLNEQRRPLEKLLLLDEFDNTLNPSLIQSLFKVIDEFFIKKGVTVVMTTHSPVTISLAPEYATFYEIFRQDDSSPKIIEVDKYQYSELKIANKNFYEKIENQESRIKELEENNKTFEADKILFVEDKYTQIYKLAWLKLNDYDTTVETIEDDFDKNSPFKVYSKGNKDSLKGYLSNEFMEECEGKKIVGLFDFDDAYNCFKDLLKNKNKQIKWNDAQGDEKTGLYSIREKYNNISALVLPVPEYRVDIAGRDYTANRLEVELLFSDDIIEKMYGTAQYKKEKIIGGIEIPKIQNKENFWVKAINLPKEDFEGFIPLFERINQLLDIKM